jgi:nitric oxide reductase NorQ protein
MSRLPYYRELGNERSLFKLAFENRLPLLLKGPTGCGKSRFVQAMAAELGRPLVSVACHDDTSATDLVGRYLIRGGDTVWQDGPLVRAIRENAILYLDELAEAREDVVVVIHPLTDHRRELFVDKTNELLSAGANFMLVASFNPGYQKRVKELKPSTRQRFLSLSFTYPSAPIEAEIISQESGIELSIAQKLASVGERVRKLEEMGLAETVSTRLLIYAATLIRAGVPSRQACDIALAQPLSDDSEIVQSINDVVALIF